MSLDGLTPAELLDLYRTASPSIKHLIVVLLHSLGIPI